jgi:epoxyqueuosine reductase
MGPATAALEIAREMGFDLAGVAPLEPPPDAERFESWLGAGRHAGLAYLERNRDRIVDPRTIVPGGRSLLVVGLAHSRAPVSLRDGGRIARYAAGRDYHNVMTRMLRRLARRLESAGIAGRSRAVVDAGPLLERSHAARAGVGFLSKAANLLHPRFGPWFFLGELVLEAELEPTGPPPPGSCGTCTACIDACPTQAILEPGLVDAGRCVSYHTIENRGSIPREIREKSAGWAFGCDVCSEVCPWGREAPDQSDRWGTHSAVADGSLVSWLEPDHPADWLLGSPLQRPKRAGLARNAAIALAHVPSPEGERALLRVLDSDARSIVRESAAWSLARAHGREPKVREALDRARRRESHASTADDMARSLDEAR